MVEAGVPADPAHVSGACDGLVAIVTGASQGGTGTAIALRLAAEGARVAVTVSGARVETWAFAVRAVRKASLGIIRTSALRTVRARNNQQA